MPIYNKLVRDRILEIIEADGLQYNARILEPQELLVEVKAKIIEEAKEFHKTVNVQEGIEELADLLELIHTAINAVGVSFEDLEGIREQKKAKRGGFDKAIYLMNVEE